MGSGGEELDFVISVDRSLMSTHHGREFLGFITTGPPVLFPDRIWEWLAAPKAKIDGRGRPVQAPYGLRKIEAALVDAGFNAGVVDPDYIEGYLKKAKAVLIGHHDYFAFNPPSSEWWLVTGREPFNRRSFLSFMRRVSRVKRSINPDLKIIVGGPAAWQWLYTPGFVKEFMVDTIVEGESDKLVVKLAEMVMDGVRLPRYISADPRELPGVDEIPVIKGASVNGLVEIMRGCPRSCKFCSVTFKQLRHIPLDVIEQEMRVNAEAGVETCILHSEDVLLYGSDSLTPNPDALIKLHKLAKKYHKSVSWSHATLAAVVEAQRKFKLITKLTEIIFDDNQQFTGFQTGVETGSAKLARQVMPAKSAPYPAERWPDVVEEAFAILHDHNIVPAGTIILGLPGETKDDVIKTIELVERLKPYRSVLVPMFFVPLGALKNRDWFRSINLTREHAELMIAMLRHTIRWARDIINTFYLKGLRVAPTKLLLNFFLDKASKFAGSLTPDQVLDYIEQSKKRLAEEATEDEPLLKPLARLKLRVASIVR